MGLIKKFIDSQEKWLEYYSKLVECYDSIIYGPEDNNCILRYTKSHQPLRYPVIFSEYSYFDYE